jgi:hypothetical protein
MSLRDKVKKLMSPRNVLIILLVLCIIVVAYILIISYKGESETVLSVKDVLNQSDELIKTGEKITVKGYYYTDYNYNENIIEITDSAVIPGPGSPIPNDKDRLLVDYSGVQNVTNFNAGSKYLFTGVLEWSPLNPESPILIASKIEPS